MPSDPACGVDSAEHHLVQSGRAAFANYSGHIIGGRAAERLAVVRERAVTERASVSIPFHDCLDLALDPSPLRPVHGGL